MKEKFYSTDLEVFDRQFR